MLVSFHNVFFVSFCLFSFLLLQSTFHKLIAIS